MRGISGSLRTSVEALAAKGVVDATVVSGGYTQAARYIVKFADGSSAFLKASTDNSTEQWLQAELQVYCSVHADFLPNMIGHTTGLDGRTFLLLEDLSGGHWPPPWSSSQIDRVIATLSRLWRTEPPAGLASFESQRPHVIGWPLVERNPAEFLSLGLCSPEWLSRALPALRRAEKAAVLGGDAFVHHDVRSDNICFFGDRTVLVDWNWASLGNPEVEIAAWLPSLHLEGGPLPDDLYAGGPESVAWFAGYLAARAGMPPPPNAERVRDVQLRQLTVALPWAARACGLPPPQ